MVSGRILDKADRVVRYVVYRLRVRWDRISRQDQLAVVETTVMDFRADGFDVWVFRAGPGGTEYLLLRASEEKADRWFGGSQFWQIPSDFVGERPVVAAVADELKRYGLVPTSTWAAEHTYTIYNRRYEAIVHIAVFAAEVEHSNAGPVLGSEHSEYAWVNAEDAARRVTFRGLKDGLWWVREFVTGRRDPLPELRLA